MAEKEWETYEDATKYLLNNIHEYLGLGKVDGKQKIKGQKTGTDWEIDITSYNADNSKLVLVECKRWSRAISQEQIASLVYKLEDIGAARGIIVTPIGLQEGAEKVAKAEKITTIKLDPCSTSDSYVAQVANQLFIKPTSDRVVVSNHVKVKIIDKES